MTKAWIILVGLALSSSAFSFGLDEGEQALINARRDYANAVFQGKFTSADEQAAYYQKTVGAASSQLDRAIVGQWVMAAQHQMTPEANENLGPQLKDLQPQIARLSKGAPKDLAQRAPASQADNSSGSGSNGEALQNTPAPSKPDVALDGSKIPRIVEFGAKKDGAGDSKPASAP